MKMEEAKKIRMYYLQISDLLKIGYILSYYVGF